MISNMRHSTHELSYLTMVKPRRSAGRRPEAGSGVRTGNTLWRPSGCTDMSRMRPPGNEYTGTEQRGATATCAGHCKG